MKTTQKLLLLGLLVFAVSAQTPSKWNPVKRPCSATITTNCTPQVSGAGAYVPSTGSGTFVTLSGDATSTATGGATTVQGLKGVPFCTGFTPTNGQLVQYTTASSPNPCYTAAAAGTAAAGGSSGQLQWNNSTVLGGVTIWSTNGTTTITGAATGILDLSAAAMLKVPVVAGGTASANGVVVYDSTAGITHVRTNGADSSVVAATATDTTTTHYLKATAVAGIGAFGAIAVGDLPTVTVAYGGTGLSTLTAHAVQVGEGTSTSAQVGPNAATTYPLFSAGSSADPAFRAIAAADIPSGLRARAVGMSFNGGGSAIALNSISYIAAVPFAGTISAWDLCVDTGTATVDVFKIATGTGLPTASITASATPAIASNNCLHSATLTGWTTSIAAGDRLAFKVTAISAATNISIMLEVDQ